MTPTPRPDVLAALRACRLWRTAGDAAVARLAAAATVQEAPRGTVLAAEGDPADRFGVVVAGRVRVYHLTADGRTVLLEALDSGDAFAAAASLAGGRNPAYVDAATPVSVAWLHRETLFAVLDDDPSVARALVADLAGQVVSLTGVVQTLSLDVPGRLARYLFQRSLAAGSATSEGLLVPLGIPKSELASALGTVPETLSRAFARLRDAGVLEVRGSDVLVFDVGALARMGSGYAD
ncbi:MAG TPA: Crp/Fnr family transcriptional regulator [Coriobacteriia bacterium]|nr:Crp/Fnr family transcriptional regulator [Coriobacteriia bacterium]